MEPGHGEGQQLQGGEALFLREINLRGGAPALLSVSSDGGFLLGDMEVADRCSFTWEEMGRARS